LPADSARLVARSSRVDADSCPSFGLDLLSTYRKPFPVSEPAWCDYSGRALAIGGDDSGARRAYRNGVRAASRLGVEMHQARLPTALSGR
jgi:hypothetical protein